MSKGKQPDGPDQDLLTFSPGDFVFEAGTKEPALFIVAAGQVELLRSQAGGLIRVALREAGDLLGEAAFFTLQPQPWAARAVSECRVLRLGPSDVDQLLLRPEAAPLLLRKLAQRLAQTEATLWEAAAPPAAAQVPEAQPAPGEKGAQVGPTGGRPRFVHASGVEFLLADTGTALVGRADPGSQFQPQIELSALDTQRSLSRRHACVARKADGYYLSEEARVPNGTFVNGKRLKAGAQVRLKDGDEVCFGLVTTTFRLA